MGLTLSRSYQYHLENELVWILQPIVLFIKQFSVPSSKWLPMTLPARIEKIDPGHV